MMNAEILGQLLDRHGAALLLYARQWSDAPEDIVQEAFLKLLKQQIPPDNIPAWLFRVVRNQAIDTVRSQNRRVQREKDFARVKETWFKIRNGLPWMPRK